ncbi:MAG: GTPase [Candidatus Thiodiazotropha sp. 6PLUC2]
MSKQQKNRSSKQIIKMLLVMLLLFLGLLILLIALQLTESALNIWQLLNQLSPSLLILYGIGLFGFSLGLVALSWRLLRSDKSHQQGRQQQTDSNLPETREAFEKALAKADAQGVDIAQAKEELDELDQRAELVQRYVAFFGPVSTGKSALIQAITGAQSIYIDPRAGTTQSIEHYTFSRDGKKLFLTDAPGILDLNKEHIRRAREEARRAHLVIYVCEGELTRDQHQELAELQGYNRPLILALNKQDRYSEEDLRAIVARIGEQFPEIELVPVQAGGQEEVIRIDAQGEQKRELRDRPPQVEPLIEAMLKKIDEEAGSLDQQRDESLLRLGAEKLHSANIAHRRGQSEKLVKGYTRKAMLGAMAAVSPGTDILIQGYLGIKMVKALCELYDVRIRDVDGEHLVDLASQNVGKRMTLLLALTGNVLKAFPGVGTVTGGLTHAVAYGLIFEALGESVVKALDQGDQFETAQILDNFEETMSGNLEARAKHLARLALEHLVKRE